MIELTKGQLAVIRAFLSQVRESATIADSDWTDACRTLAKTAQWTRYRLSGADIAMAIWWYRFRHKPGSQEWRPGTIIRALIIASERDYAEPERIEPIPAVLAATSADKTNAKRAFIRKHGVAAFYRSIRPILARERRGVSSLIFQVPATPDLRQYVDILTTIVKARIEREWTITATNRAMEILTL